MSRWPILHLPKRRKDRRTGTYVAVKYDHAIDEILQEWCERNQIPNAVKIEKLHTTVLYSRVPVAEEHHVNYSALKMRELNWRFLPLSFDTFPAGSNKKEKALVLRIRAPELIRLHNVLLENGGTHDFPSLEPHVTLSYDLPEDFDISKLVTPPVYFVPTLIYTEPLDLDW